MPSTDAILAALDWNWRMVDATLAGLDDSVLACRPNPECNSIAWTLWHMNRVLDTFVHQGIGSEAPLWLRDGWCDRFGMNHAPGDHGVGWSAKQLAAWVPPGKGVQLGYYEAVKQAAYVRIAGLTDNELDQCRVIPPVAEPRIVAQVLGKITWDNISHGGQISYIRGLFQGTGWYPR